jgi:hypothetical protein
MGLTRRFALIEAKKTEKKGGKSLRTASSQVAFAVRYPERRIIS